jgi:transcription elongation factor S-II
MTTKELASDELKTRRKEMIESATLAKRADIYQIARAEIAKANDIDPSKGGEFRCGRCKSTNTVHNEKQTRSSDEPMTVFVCCLNCGKRWRF